jgi:hypothetical protein
VSLGLQSVDHRQKEEIEKQIDWILKEATVKRYYYHSYDSLRRPLKTFYRGLQFCRVLKTLRGLIFLQMRLQSVDTTADYLG